MVFAEVLKNLSNPIVWTLLSFSLIHFKDFRNLVPRILSLLRGRERTLGTRRVCKNSRHFLIWQMGPATTKSTVTRTSQIFIVKNEENSSFARFTCALFLILRFVRCAAILFPINELKWLVLRIHGPNSFKLRRIFFLQTADTNSWIAKRILCKHNDLE